MPLSINTQQDEEERRRREQQQNMQNQQQTALAQRIQENSTPQLTQPQNAQQSLMRKEDPTTVKWYKGEQPTSSELLARIYTIGQQDRAAGEEMYKAFTAARQDPTSPIYDAYSKGTNYAITALSELGVDMSGGVTPEWLQENQGYLQHLKYNQAGNVQAPTKRSSREEKIAYQMYQLFQDEDLTEQAEAEWRAYQEEVAYWATRDDLNLSDEEIMAKIDPSKYKTLAKMDANRENPISLNRAVGYNQDAISGVIWAARNGVDLNDPYNSVRAALGQGKQYAPDEELRQRLTPGSPTYAPYSVCTLDDAALYFGVDSFDQQWLNDHMAYRDSNDETARNMYNAVYKAELTTRKAEEEMAALREVLDKKLKSSTDPDRVLKAINWEKDYPTLYAMNETLNGGPKLMTTRGIDFSQDAIKKEIADKCQYNKLAKTGRALCEWFSDFTGIPVEYDENLIAINQNRSNNIQTGSETIETNGTPEEQVVFNSGSSPTQDADMLALSNNLDSPNFDGQKGYNYIIQNADDAAVRDYLPAHATITEYEGLEKQLKEIDGAIEELDKQPTTGSQFASFMSAGTGDTGTLDFGGNTNGLPDAMKKVFAELNEKGIKNPMDPNLTPEQKKIVDEVFMAHGASAPSTLNSDEQEKAREKRAQLENQRSQIQAEMEAMQGEYQEAVQTVKGIQEQYEAGDLVAALTGTEKGDGYNMLAMQDEYFRLGKDPVAINRESYSAYDMMLGFPGVDINAVKQFAALDIAQYEEEIRRIDEVIDYLTKGDTDYSFINRDLSMDRGGVEYYKNIMDRRDAYERQIKAAKYFLVRTNPDFDKVAQVERDNINSGKAEKISQIDIEAAADKDTYELQPGIDTYMIAMDDEERDTYLYLRATQGADAAQEYYNYMTNRTYGPMITRMAERTAEAYEQIGKDSPILGTLMTIAGSPFQAVGTVYSIAADMLGLDINPNDPAFDATRFNNEIRGAAKEGITKYWGEGTVGDFIGNLLYDASTSAADSLLNAFIFGGLGAGAGALSAEATSALGKFGLKAASSLLSAAPMGMQAASSAIWNAKQLGATNEQALLMGGFTFLSETVTEALTFDNIADSYALGKSADAASWKKAFINFATKYLDEPVGEGLSEIIGKLSDTAIMGKLSEKERIIAAYTADGKMSEQEAEAQYWRDFWSDVGMASLTAIVSSGAQTLVSYGTGKLGQAAEDRSMEKAVTDAEQKVSDLQVQLDADPDDVGLQKRFAAAKEEVENRRQALRDYRAKQEEVSPEAQTQELQDSVTEAEQEVADIQTELESNPDDVSLQEMLAAANEELAKRQKALDDFKAKAEETVSQLGRHAGGSVMNGDESYQGRHSVQTEEGAQEAAENVARVDENGNVVEPYEGRHRRTTEGYEGLHEATPDPHEVVVSETESNYQGRHKPAPEVVVSQPIQNGSRVARQIEMLSMADSINPSGQAAAMGAVLMPSTQRDLFSTGLASAAGQHLQDKYGTSAVRMLRRAVTTAARNGIDINNVTFLMSEAALADEGSATAQALDILVQESEATGTTSPEALQTFQAIAMMDMTPDKLTAMRKKVEEHLTASKIRDYIAEGALNGVGPFEIALGHAMQEQQNASEALKREENTRDQMQEDLKNKHKDFIEDPGNTRKKDAVNRATNDLDGQNKVVEEYGMRRENADRAVAEAQKDLDQKRNELLTPLREQAAAEVRQELQADQQRQADEAAAAQAAQQAQQAAEQEAQHQQTLQDQRSGKLKEESTRAKLERRAQQKGLTGKAAENYVNSVLQHARDRELNKIDMTRQLSATDADLVMGSLERRFGVKVKTEELADGINGFYDRDTDSITLNKKLPAGQVLVEFGLHELTHSLEKTGAYQQYHDTALNILFPTQAEMDSAVADKIASYDAQGIRIDRAQALREIVADFTRTRLNSADVVQRMVDGGLGGRMRAALHNINQFLRNKLTRMDPQTRQTAENLRRAERMFQKALNEKEKAKKQTGAKQVSNGQVEYSAGGKKGYLLDPGEYRRLQDNLSAMNRGEGEGFVRRSNGGVLVAMDNALVYTDRNGQPEHTIRLNSENLWDVNDFQQDAMRFEKDGVDFDVQRKILQSVYGEDCADFDTLRTPKETRRSFRRGKDSFEGNTGAGDRGDLSLQTGEGTEYSAGGELTAAQLDAELKTLDDNYSAAVERGDMEAAQAAMKQAAEQAGYTREAFHGTKRQFNSFKFTGDDIGIHLGTRGQARMKAGRGKDARMIDAYVSLHNPVKFSYDLGSWDGPRVARELFNMGIITQEEAANALLSKDRTYRLSDEAATKNIRNLLINKGYDGFVYDNEYEGYSRNNQQSIAVFSPEQIKSAEVVTHDRDGNLIPLSERFNPAVNDIRYSAGVDEMTTAQMDAEIEALDDQTNSEQFKQWFKGSKIVDENGDPLVVYHGTSEQFTVFDPSKGRSTMDIQGSFFSPWEIDAGGYGENVGAYYLSIKNPAPEQVAYAALRRFQGQNEAGKKAREYLEAQGYDGVNNENEEFIAFYPEQIKSATDNVGTFDSSNPDYRYSAGDGQLTEEQMDQELIEAGVITPEELPPQRQFGRRTAQNSDLDERVKEHLYNNSAYTPDTNRAQINRAIEWIHQLADKDDPSGFQNALQTVFDGTFNPHGADGTARLLTLMSLAATQGSLNDQIRLADFYNREGTTAGQQMQARKMIRLMTPIGRIALLKQQANKLTDELARKGIKKEITLSDWTLQAAAEAKTEEDFDKVRKAANEELADQLPVSWKERLQSWRMLAMLLNTRTHVRNLVGNALFIPAVSLKNKLGAVAERMSKQPAGQRTKTLSLALPQDIRDFARQDAKNIRDVLTGEAKYNDRTAIQRNKQTLPGFLQTLSDFNSKALEGEDWFFLKGHYRRALGGWMQANGYSVEQVQSNPELLQKGREYATQEAQKATYRDANQIAQTLSEISRKGGPMGMFVDAILPFKKTPANILKRGIEYSPIGFVKALTADAVHLKQYRDWQNGQYSKMPDKALTPNQWIDNLCSGLSGSAIFALGMLLSNMGVISVGLDDDDDEFDKLEGDQEYSVKIFGHSYTIDWAAPACMPFFVGAAVREMATREGGYTAQDLVDAAANIADPVFSLSMLDGVNSLFRTSQSEETNNLMQILYKAGTNYLTSFLPSASGAFARSWDPVRRKAFVKSGETSGLTGQLRYAREQTENKILGLSQTNIPVRDAFGRTSSDSTVERILENFISPGYHTTMQNDPVVEELRSLYEATNNKNMIPKLPSKTMSVNKETIPLEAEEYDKLTEERGTTAYKIISELMASDFYKGVSERDRAAMITDAWTYATQTANRSVKKDYNVDAWVTNSMKNPTRSILNRAKDRIEKDYKDGCKIAAVEAVESEDFEALDTVIAKYEEAGGKKSQIKTAVGNAYKEEYLRAYQADDYATMDEIEVLLESTDLGFSEADFNKWIDSVENQIRDDEEEE